MKPNWPLLSLLRFALALTVFVAHPPGIFAGAPQFNAFGPVSAVAGFFILSGYSIAHSLKRAPAGFYARRIKRIYPEIVIGFVMVAVAFAWRGPMLLLGAVSIEAPATVPMFFRELLPGWSWAWPAPKWNPALWSMGIEEVYYCLAPLLLFLPVRWIAGLAIMSAACFVFGSWQTPLAMAWLWLIGYLLAVAPAKTRLTLAFVPVALWSAKNPVPESAVCLAVVVSTLLFQHEITVPEAWHKAAKRLGDFSYTLYALHFPTWILLHVAGVTDWRVAVPVSFAALFGVHLLIEGRKAINKTQTDPAHTCKEPLFALR